MQIPQKDIRVTRW